MCAKILSAMKVYEISMYMFLSPNHNNYVLQL